MERSLVGMGADMLHQLSAGRKTLPALRALVNLPSRRLSSSTSAVPLDAVQSMFFQLVGGRQSTPAVTGVRLPVAVQDQMLGQLRCRFELHVTPRTVQQLHGDDAVHLYGFRLRRRLYVSIEMVGELRLQAETLVADSALVLQFLLDG